MSSGFHNGFEAVTASSWGNDMSFYMVVANSIQDEQEPL